MEMTQFELFLFWFRVYPETPDPQAQGDYQDPGASPETPGFPAHRYARSNEFLSSQQLNFEQATS